MVELMDEIRANRMTEELIGKSVGQWELIQYLGCGKSALVFEGMCLGRKGAVKVFDPEMVQRFGKGTQLQRIQRELLVRDKIHENLICIIDGGECSATGYLFVVMECLEGTTLESVIKDIPRNDIQLIISQVASAAQYLESLELCHRDIKPSNIAINADYQKSTLLDLGVLRPIGNSDLTDEEARHFIGTLRYSSPEFLMRAELDTIEGWRAVTFYQLGAVLHDLIMKKPLFHEYSEPYARLVEAVKNVNPIIEADDISPDLIHLARTCLIKDPNVRLLLIRWNSFSLVARSLSPVQAAKERVRQRYVAAQSEVVDTPPIEEREERRRDRLHRQIIDKIERIIRLECVGGKSFPPMLVKRTVGCVPNCSQLLVTFHPSLVHQLPLSLHLAISSVLLDADTEAISLSYWSAVGGEGVEFPEERFHLLFDGAYNEMLVKEKIEMFLYLSLDAAQNFRIKSDVELIPIGPFEEIGG